MRPARHLPPGLCCVVTPLDLGARGATARTVKQALVVPAVAARDRSSPELPPRALAPSRAVTSAKGHRHEAAWTHGPAQLDPQTADGAKTVRWPRGRGPGTRSGGAELALSERDCQAGLAGV